MSIEIKSRYGGRVLYTAKNAADVREAVLEAVKADAYLGDAYLGDANLRDAYLGDAYLGDANLGDAKGLAVERVNDLLILLDQPGKIRAYKLVTGGLKSPMQNRGRLTYEIGSTVEAEAETDPNVQCGPGVNLATLPWCLQNWQPGHRILLMEFTKKDIAAIPVGDGKFRVSKAKVVREVDLEPIFESEKVEDDPDA